MRGESETEFTAERPAPWLEVLDGHSPILLIAPHGGRAGPAARRRPDPKVNDLFTAQITRTLAERLSAGALINAAMDRNQLDCNRLGQLVEHAPWLLELIDRRLEEIVARHGRAIVLVIHGWNVIEPRVDLGLGARLRGGRLVPAGAAHISASDEFVNRTVAALAERLSRSGIVPSFGHRYPAGGFHNLLQAFTPRHLESPYPALRRLAAMAARHTIDALQLEMSVAVRMSDSLRAHALDAIAGVFRNGFGSEVLPAAPPIPVVRAVRPKAPPTAPKAPRPVMAARVGLEFFDPAAGLGAMASFDLGPAAMGARIMMLLDRGRVALFTGEGVSHRDGGRIALGPLALESHGREVALNFAGPAVLVPDGSAYLSIERALASGAIDDGAEVAARLCIKGAPLDLEQLLAGDHAAPPAEWVAAFGRLAGTIRIGGETREIDAVGRVGLSFTSVGSARFVSRRMVWACFPESAGCTALEARAIRNDDGSGHHEARALNHEGWGRCDLSGLELEAPALDAPPAGIAARVACQGVAAASLLGEVRNFVPLSRPGPNQSRIYTALGFASFRLGPHEGAGMFEYSRRSAPIASSGGDGSDDDAG